MPSAKAPRRANAKTGPVGKIALPDWMPPDEREAWEIFYPGVSADDREMRYMLQQLATRVEMKDAWTEIRSLKASPISLVTLTLSIWMSARIVKERKLGFASMPPALALAKQARTVADAVRATHPTIQAWNGITDATMVELDRVAAFFREEARYIANAIHFTPLPRKIRARNAPEVAFVNHMCDWLLRLYERRPYNLIAILTNVVFDPPVDRQWDADRVKHCYRSRSGNK